MEKSERESDSPRPYESSDAQVGEEIAEKKPQQQQVPQSQMKDEQMLAEIAKETKNEISESLTGSHEKEQILQSKIEQDEESKQSVSEEPAKSAGMKHESLSRDCEKQSTVQATTQIQKVEATKGPSEPSGAMNCRLTIAAIVARVMNELPAERIPESSVILTWMEEQNVLESDRGLEPGSESQPSKESEQESPVREAQQAMELVLEEAAICFSGQEPMEEADDPSGTISCRPTIEDIVERGSDVPVERTTESSKMAQKTTVSERSEEIRARVEEEQNVPESDRCLEPGSESQPSEESEQVSPVREAQQVLELVLEEAAICYMKQEPMEEAEDIEDPQKYAFRDKDLD
ncbi:uncharacterized protein LOC129957089 [Argiope bruennichi]|uniref:uncharacterized protein LOC129957089 n=1 Tax=Argiope bruennichi TaxID=94029 RepID=UPI0024957502|nr:uncharacterized protein LOC129957089 [Argiope bruennichi]